MRPLEDATVLADALQAGRATGAATTAGPICTVPIFRILDEDDAKAFYLSFMGFALDWERGAGTCYYAQLSRSGLVLHLSADPRGALPGAMAIVVMSGVAAAAAELDRQACGMGRSTLRIAGDRELFEVTDPFGNVLRFVEHRPRQEA